MNRQVLTTYKLSDSHGVYLFLGSRRKVLYIGKATSLKERVKSYFSSRVLKERGTLIGQMVEQAVKLETIPTDSVVEALLLEARLIKKHTPKYNTELKDDKSFNYIGITREEFPAVTLIRERLLSGEFDRFRSLYGPFPHGGQLKEALKIIRKIFPFRDEKCVPRGGRPCFNRQIGLCPGVCDGAIDARAYKRRVKNVELFLSGEKERLILNLEKGMRAAARKLAFEEAEEMKRELFSLKHIHDIALLKREKNGAAGFRVEGYDIAHTGGAHVVGAMTVVADGEKQPEEYRKFKIKSFAGADDTRALAEILSRRLEHAEWSMPRLIVVDGGIAQKNAAEKVLSSAGVGIPVVAVTKDEYHRPKKVLGDRAIVFLREHDILLANSEAHRFVLKYHRSKRDTIR